MPESTWKPVRSIKECDAIITAPGQFHELERTFIDGRLYRVYKNLWPSIRDYWLSVVSNDTKIHARDYIVFEEFRLTYGQADELVQRTASIFREVYGIRKGDRVGIAMRNYPEWIISFFAAHLLGAIPTLFNAWLPTEPFVHCITLTTPKLLVVDSERLQLLGSFLRSSDIPIILVRPGSSPPANDLKIREWSKVLDLYSGPIKAWEKEPTPLPEDDATIFFTSGTTGIPKAVLSTQRQFLGNYFNTMLAVRRRELRIGQDLPPPVGSGPVPQDAQPPAALIAVPLFHVTGCTGQLINTTTSGGKVVLMYKWEKEKGAELWVKENITSTAGVPSIAYDLMESSLAGSKAVGGVGFGGGPAADTLVGELKQKFPNAVIQQGYGLSETNSLSVSIFGEDFLARPGSTGLPLVPVDIIVIDPETHKELPTGEIGEIWIRGPNVMRGYYKNPKATEESITRDGWFKSGDLGSIDEEGFVYIKDRLKDMIIRGGENIHSMVVENALFSDERVLECAAVGIPDKRLGELVGAVVVPRSQWVGKLTEEDILSTIRGRLPKFAVPSMIHVQDAGLERNAAGKVLKQGLRRQLREVWDRKAKAKGKL